MSISSSIYIGTTGILAMQEGMSVISDNIANVSTTGFKSSTVNFGTLISQQLEASTVQNQVGQGVGVSSIYRNMSVGSLETTNTSTDLAINGTGFFIVSPENSTDVYYTRAGSFRFDATGILRDASGNILQGYALGEDGTVPDAGTVTLQDIQLNLDADGNVISAPEATSEVRMMVNLDSESTDSTTSDTSPFTALFDSWDATQDPPLSEDGYAYESSITIYDANGDSHVLTAYFDPVSDISDDTSGYKTWEYLVTIPAADDGSALAAKQGVVMAGTLTFSPAGELVSMSAFSGTSDDKSTWTPAELSADGFPMLNITLANGTTVSSVLDIGISAPNGWSLPDGVTTMADISTYFADLPTMDGAVKGAMSFTNYSTGSSTIYQNQNGYEQGYLQTVEVDSTGTLIGNFSNGQDQALYKIPLADFINPQGLFREGGNLFSATTDSGAASVDWAGQGRLGDITSNALESSNVDLATEFVNMIITQKGFEANGKVITTSDQVVQTALAMRK